MPWKEVDLLADLDARFGSHGTPEIQGTGEDPAGYTWLISNVLDSGTSEKSKNPTAQRRNVHYYVYHRGQVDEEAWYTEREPDPVCNTDITATANTAYSYAKIFDSIELRTRVRGFMIKAADAIIHELPTVPDHAQRLAWSYQASKNLLTSLDAFMVQIACNPTARSQGNAISDTDLEWIVNSEIVTIATIFGL